MVLVKRFDMNYRNTLLIALTVIFASCGGGGSGGNPINQIIAPIINDNVVINMIPVGF